MTARDLAMTFYGVIICIASLFVLTSDYSIIPPTFIVAGFIVITTFAFTGASK